MSENHSMGRGGSFQIGPDGKRELREETSQARAEVKPQATAPVTQKTAQRPRTKAKP